MNGMEIKWNKGRKRVGITYMPFASEGGVERVAKIAWRIVDNTQRDERTCNTC